MIYTVTLNPAIDLVVRLDGPLQADAVNRAAGEEYVLGGKGINVSGVLAELGCPSVALGFVAGATGVWLEQGLAARGLRTDFIRLPAGMTRINLKLKDGRETEINGAGPTVPPEAVEALLRKLDALQSGDVLVLAGSLPAGLPADTYETMLARLEGRGVQTVVDASGPLLEQALRSRPFLIKPNREELAQAVGRAVNTEAETEQAARELQARGARNVLVSCGGDGALLLEESGAVHCAAAPRGIVVNSVGAGDSMLAGFVAGWLQSGSFTSALRLGIACGSATAFSLGLAGRSQIDALLAQI